jgi:penicillin-binding protein 1A
MKWRTRLLRFLFWILVLGLLAGFAAAGWVYVYLVPKLPETEQLRDVRFQVPLRVYSREGLLIAEFGEKRRIPLVYQQIPEVMVQAILAAEDDRFFQHPGVDYQGLVRAAVELVLTGERRQGGSTITMQVARNFFLTREKTFLRKINEILLALRIERELPKEEILALYLNKIYLGNRAYGVGAAAQVYYGRSLDELTLAQTAMIAGLPKAPSRDNPIANPARALERRAYVLKRMASLGFITPEQLAEALAAPVTASLHSAEIELPAPYVAEMVRADLVERYGEEAYTMGYGVHTTIDARLQRAAGPAVRNALDAYDERHGYRGPEAHFDLAPDADQGQLQSLLAEHDPIGELVPALVLTVEERAARVLLRDGAIVTVEWEGLKWARPLIDENRRGRAPKQASDILSRGDLVRLKPLEPGQSESETGGVDQVWRLAQIPAVEGALVSVDPDNGAIRALVGGYDFFHSKFNRVTQARRQPGSGFKAVIYSAALEAGFTPASLINDAPVVFDDPSLEGAWRPENYSGKFFGPTRLRVALTKSRNLVSIRLLRAIGIDRAIEHATRFGFSPSELPRNLSLALGSTSVTPLQMARAFSVLANGGYLIDPYLIERIELEGESEPVFQAEPPTVCQSCPEAAASSVRVVGTDSGPSEARQTGTEALPVAAAPRTISPENHFLMNSMLRDVVRAGTARRARALGRNDIAGKTGTTNDQRDAWFNGFHPSRVAVVWVGFDDSSPLGRGETGGRAALPAWISFMEEALKGVPEELPSMPPGMVTVRIDPKTGRRAAAGQPGSIFEVFRADHVPEAPDETQGAVGGSGGVGAGMVESLF